MDTKTFLKLYTKPLSKLHLKGVHFLKKDENDQGKKYYHFIGLFELKLPVEFQNEKNPNKNKEKVLKDLKDKLDYSSFIYRKKYNRKIKKNGETANWDFNYIFDFTPTNIVDYNIIENDDKLELQVIGYGKF